MIRSQLFIPMLALGVSMTVGAQSPAPKYELINNPAYATNDLAVATCNALDYGADPTGRTYCTALL